ncbi:hypothetical protein ABFA07_006374 [Porites harrisoni]
MADNLPANLGVKPMEWTMAHDILLCREMLATNPFKAKGKTIQRTKIWETVVQHPEEIEEPPFKITVRAVRDRYSLECLVNKKQVELAPKCLSWTSFWKNSLG